MSKITESARDETCQIRIPFVCAHVNPVWCHWNGISIGKGIGMKSDDILGAYGCQPCHDVYDRRREIPKEAQEHGITRADVELAFADGHARSLVRLLERGIVRLA